MKLLLFICSLFFSGCGIDEADFNQCQEQCDQSDVKTDDSQITQDEEKTEETTEEPTKYRETEEYEDVPLLLMKRMMSWDQAVSDAPEGYHLPTLEELQALIGEATVEGENAGMVQPKMVWTMTKSYETSSWAVDFKDGSQHSYDRRVYLEVIYIGDYE